MGKKCSMSLKMSITDPAGKRTDQAGADKPGSGLKYHSVIPGDKGVLKMIS